MWDTFMGGVYKMALHNLPSSFFITGCNRGLGLEFVRQLVLRDEGQDGTDRLRHVFATYRNPDTAQELKSLAEKHPCIHLVKLDMHDFASFSKVASEVDKVVGEDGLNVLINNAGTSPKFTRIGMVKAEAMVDTFMVNTLAPVLLTKEMVPMLKRAAAKNTDKPFGVSRAAVVNMSSILGSMEKNVEGGFYPYRCSKAALNAATRSLSNDLAADNIMVVSLHPGWVKTGLGGPKAPLTTEESIGGILNVLKFLTHKHNGQFIQYDGSKVPW